MIECVEGPSLREVLERERPPVDRVPDVATQFASGLARVDERGIVNRDAGPSTLICVTIK